MSEQHDKTRQQVLVQQVDQLIEEEKRLELTKLLNEERSSDIAEIVQLVDEDEKRIIFDVLDKPLAAEVLEKVDEATRSRLFEILDDKELIMIVMHLDADDAADVLAELPEEEIAEILKNIPHEESREIEQLMSYSEDTAGGIMDTVIIDVTENATVAEAVNKIRNAEIDEDFYSVFVVNDKGRFLGDVRIRELLTKPEKTRIGDIMETDTVYVNAHADQEEVRNIFRNNDLIVVPVLDDNHKLIGRITADRIIEVADEEAAEDFYAMAGTDPDELDTFNALRAARIRMTFLLPCLIGTGVTAAVMMFFKQQDPFVFVIAAAFVPMIAAISGNAGLQTSAIVVSGLATGHLAALKLNQVFDREVKIATLVALSCGILGGAFCAILLSFRHISETINAVNLVIAFTLAMFSAIMVATTLGLLLPFLFRKIGIDPAISSGPLVTTANDSISVAIYLTLALTLVN